MPFDVGLLSLQIAGFKSKLAITLVILTCCQCSKANPINGNYSNPKTIAFLWAGLSAFSGAAARSSTYQDDGLNWYRRIITYLSHKPDRVSYSVPLEFIKY